jgi:hypothetical protein
VPEGAGEALLFAAATFGAQGLTLAWRGGMPATGSAGRAGEPARERVG